MIALLAAGAYSCIFAHQMGFAMLAQFLYLVSQINAIDFSLENIKFIGIQLLILVIIVSALVHHNFDGKSEQDSGDVNSQTTEKAIRSENLNAGSAKAGGTKKKRN